MVDVVNAPLYKAGDVLYLGHKSGMPTKVYIEAVYMKANSKEWMYCIYSEITKEPAYVPESILSNRVARHSSKVYNLSDVKRRVANGFRFSGNYPTSEAINRGEEFARNADICSVWLHPALDANGKEINGQYGIWIKWKYVIKDSRDCVTQSVRVK